MKTIVSELFPLLGLANYLPTCQVPSNLNSLARLFFSITEPYKYS